MEAENIWFYRCRTPLDRNQRTIHTYFECGHPYPIFWHIHRCSQYGMWNGIGCHNLCNSYNNNKSQKKQDILRNHSTALHLCHDAVGYTYCHGMLYCRNGSIRCIIKIIQNSNTFHHCICIFPFYIDFYKYWQQQSANSPHALCIQ